MELAKMASELYRDNKNDELFGLAEKTWTDMGGGQPPDGAAEVFRYAFIRARQYGMQVDSHLWLARSLTAAVMTNARDTAAGLLLPHFFAATDLSKEDLGGHEKARLILDEMKRLVPEGSPEWQGLFGRLFHEKRACSFLVQGTGGCAPLPGAQGLLEHAAKEYEMAPRYVGDDKREELKVRGGVALTNYLLLAYDSEKPSSGAKDPFLKETREILESAAKGGFKDVKDWAQINVDVMELGVYEGWTPYEIL